MSAQTSSLQAKNRDGAGKGFARRVRSEGLVPAVVYGKHLEKPLNIAVDADAVREAIATPKKLNTLITLDVGGKKHTVLLKDYQQDPLSRELLHADFIDVKENEQVKVKLPVVLVGKAVGVADGGILSQQRREIEVWSLPGAIPEKLEVDVTPLKITQAMHINDVKLPAGITVKTHVNYTIAVVSIPEAEVVATPVAAAAAPGAAGAAPADGAA
ncbi:MAG: 50S ribosomal protein L25/general stress protein Ctc, partial [Myxococcaceae bacterium]|nr:50S ribosomal protein L25/general stress protein Ctc [Myxococcaceae bacterium]